MARKFGIVIVIGIELNILQIAQIQGFIYSSFKTFLWFPGDIQIIIEPGKNAT